MPYDKTKSSFRHGEADVGRAAAAKHAAAITKADADLAAYPYSLYVGTGGSLAVIPEESPDDTVVTFANVPDGFILPMGVRQVRTASTAADIVGFYAEGGV